MCLLTSNVRVAVFLERPKRVTYFCLSCSRSDAQQSVEGVRHRLREGFQEVTS